MSSNTAPTSSPLFKLPWELLQHVVQLLGAPQFELGRLLRLTRWPVWQAVVTRALWRTPTMMSSGGWLPGGRAPHKNVCCADRGQVQHLAPHAQYVRVVIIKDFEGTSASLARTSAFELFKQCGKPQTVMLDVPQESQVLTTVAGFSTVLSHLQRQSLLADFCILQLVLGEQRDTVTVAAQMRRWRSSYPRHYGITGKPVDENDTRVQPHAMHVAFGGLKQDDIDEVCKSVSTARFALLTIASCDPNLKLSLRKHAKKQRIFCDFTASLCEVSASSRSSPLHLLGAVNITTRCCVATKASVSLELHRNRPAKDRTSLLACLPRTLKELSIHVVTGRRHAQSTAQAAQAVFLCSSPILKQLSKAIKKSLKSLEVLRFCIAQRDVVTAARASLLKSSDFLREWSQTHSLILEELPEQ